MASCSTSTANRAGRTRQGLLLAFCASFLFNACAKDNPAAVANIVRTWVSGEAVT